MGLPRRAVAWGGAALLGVAGAFAGRAWLGRDRAVAGQSVRSFERLVGRQAPPMLLVDAEGGLRRLEELRGRPVLLHLWASWCPPCRSELPALLELGRRLAGAGELELVALTVDDDWAPVRELFGGQIPGEVVMDANDTAAESWRLGELPETYLLGPDGSVLLRFAGPRDWREEGAAALLRGALGAQR